MKISIKQTITNPQQVAIRRMSSKEECENQLKLINGIITNINNGLRKALK